MSDEWTCGPHEDTNPPFAQTIISTPCLGDKGPCDRQVVIFFVGLDDADGSHAIPPLCFTGSCARHRQKVGRTAGKLAIEWFGLAEVTPARVPALLAWFHGPSGLCLGDRPLSVVSPSRTQARRDGPFGR